MTSLTKKIISVVAIIACVFFFSACNTNKCADGHTWELSSTTATCLNDGIETYTCKKCKETKTENVEAYGHDFVLSSRTEPTCKTNGEEVKKCSRCGFESKQTLLIIDHDYQVKSTTPSTCTVKGSQLLECSMCHETKTESLELAQHTYELQNTVPSTCTVKGTNYYKCKNCTASKSEDLELVPHNYEKATVQSTCFTHGGEKEICSVCGDTISLTETPLLVHEFGADGYCTHCGIYKTLFDETKINATYKGVTVKGSLIPKFKESGTIDDSYWKGCTVTLTLSLYNQDNELLETHSFNSTTIPHTGNNYEKLTIQYVSTEGLIGDGYANGFIIFTNEGNIFSGDSRANCKSFKITLSCDGYETIEKIYQITEN